MAAVAPDAPDPLTAVFRREWPRLLAGLIRFTGSPELAEDALQEAFVRAADARDRGLLLNPAAWVTTTARRIAVDAVRRDAALRRRLPALVADPEPPPTASPAVMDDRLELVVLACAAPLPADQRIALSLRFVLGLGTAAVADVLLVQHTAMSARLTRAKRRLESAGVASLGGDPERLQTALDASLDAVLAVVHSFYTVGHTLPAGTELADREVSATAIELARELHRLRPGRSDVTGLLALLLLTEARGAGRVRDGVPVDLEHADRSRWDTRLRDEGLRLATAALPGMGRYALEAGIAGIHTSAPHWADTDWRAAATLYDRLVERWPSPSARVARVVARSHCPGGLSRALAELDALGDLPPAAARQARAARADVLRRLGRTAEARAAYAEVRRTEDNRAVGAWLDERLRALDD